jgi:hypothetical protein
VIGAPDLNPRPHGPDPCELSSRNVANDRFQFGLSAEERGCVVIQGYFPAGLLHEVVHASGYCASAGRGTFFNWDDEPPFLSHSMHSGQTICSCWLAGARSSLGSPHSDAAKSSRTKCSRGSRPRPAARKTMTR